MTTNSDDLGLDGRNEMMPPYGVEERGHGDALVIAAALDTIGAQGWDTCKWTREQRYRFLERAASSLRAFVGEADGTVAALRQDRDRLQLAGLRLLKYATDCGGHYMVHQGEIQTLRAALDPTPTREET